jgi:hypothetical protein
MVVTIKAGSDASAGAAATGQPGQGHFLYAVNQPAYWGLFLSGTQKLSALYSTDHGATWNAPTGGGFTYPFTLDFNHLSEGRNYGFAYANIASTDILHMISTINNGGVTHVYHTRFTLGTTWTVTNAETEINGGFGGGVGPTYFGSMCVLNSAAKPIDCTGAWNASANTGMEAAIATNADAGTGSPAWTAGFGSPFRSSYTPAVFPSCFDAFSIGSGNIIEISDDMNGSVAGKMVQLEYAPITSGSYGTSGKVLGSTVTETDSNAWGAAARTTSDIHVVALSDATSIYVHRRGNPTTWSDSSGAPAPLAYGTNSGIRLITDGTSVWAGLFDTSKRLQVNKWSNGWSGWTVQEPARPNTPSHLTGTYNATDKEILWAWTEANGLNFDIMGSIMSTTGGLTIYGSSALMGAA